jgi:hypothetical protein
VLTSAALRPIPAIGVVIALVLSGGCETTSLAPVSTPVIQQLGPTTVRAGASGLWAVVDYRAAAGSLGSEWLVLTAAVTAADRQSVRLERSEIFIRTPSGTRIPLLSQAEFRTAWPQLRGSLRRADVAAAPLWAYFPHDRRRCEFEFLAPPGGSSYDSVEINDRRVCAEQLVFRVPGGIQPGRWVLGFNLTEGDVRIPFDLQ